MKPLRSKTKRVPAPFLALALLALLPCANRAARAADGEIVYQQKLLSYPFQPIVPLTIFHARKTYQALAAGYTVRDLRAAG